MAAQKLVYVVLDADSNHPRYLGWTNRWTSLRILAGEFSPEEARIQIDHLAPLCGRPSLSTEPVPQEQPVRRRRAKKAVTGRYYVKTALQSPVGRKNRTPHAVIDSTTNETLEEYASKRAANMHAKELNAAQK